MAFNPPDSPTQLAASQRIAAALKALDRAMAAQSLDNQPIVRRPLDPLKAARGWDF